VGFWSTIFGTPNHEGVTPNSNPSATPPTVGPGDYTPGDPEGITFDNWDDEETFARSFPIIQPSPWDGWPAEWSTPNWGRGLQKLVDTARDCIDLNSSILAAMPVYRVASGQVQAPLSWMSNPDPAIYTSWNEFARQLFTDYQLGEAFVMPSDFYANGKPMHFRVVPPYLVKADMGAGHRLYKIGSVDVTADILHVRYNSSTDQPHGWGPLEDAGARMTAAKLLTERMTKLASTGGQTLEWISSDQPINKPQSDELLDQWLESKQRSQGLAGVFGRGADLKQATMMSAKEMALLELAQFTESRIAVKLGVPPYLVGLPSGGDPMTYSNVTQLFDFHHRAGLNTKVAAVMSALSGWALPRGQRVELNRDEYTRPSFNDRAAGYKALAETGVALGQPVITADEIRTMERLQGDVPEEAPTAADALTGGNEL
jgi:hypothetical protein